MQTRPRARRALRLLLFAASAIGALLGVALLWDHLTTDPLVDIRAYYDAGARLNAGQPLYDHGPDSKEYFYPPLLATVLRPFVLLPYPVFAALWEGLIVLAFVLTLYRVGIRKSSTWLAVGLLGVPIAWTLAIGQAQALVTLFVVLGSPLSIALAAQLKIFPALIALFWIGRRDWPALGRFVAWSLGLGLFQLVTEPRGLIDFFTVTNLERVGDVRNWSPYTISPVIWAALVFAGAVGTLALARSRWGWAAAVVFSTLATPRLLTYMLMTLLAAIRPTERKRVADPATEPETSVEVGERLETTRRVSAQP